MLAMVDTTGSALVEQRYQFVALIHSPCLCTCTHVSLLAAGSPLQSSPSPLSPIRIPLLAPMSLPFPTFSRCSPAPLLPAATSPSPLPIDDRPLLLPHTGLQILQPLRHSQHFSRRIPAKEPGEIADDGDRCDSRLSWSEALTKKAVDSQNDADNLGQCNGRSFQCSSDSNANEIQQKDFKDSVPTEDSNHEETINLETGLCFRMDYDLPDVEYLIITAKKLQGNIEVEHVRNLYRDICENGLEFLTCIINQIISLYVDCKSMVDAQQVLEKLDRRTEHSWTSFMSGWVQCGQFEDAIDLQQKMLKDCVHPSSYTFVVLLKACAELKHLERGRQIHKEIKKANHMNELPVGNTLVAMYAKCGSLGEAQEVFDNLSVRNVVSWTALVTGYTEYGPFEEALRYFLLMKEDGIAPNDVSFACVLKACGKLGAIDKGQKIHTEILLAGLENEILIGNTLIDMYARCGFLVEADYVFHKLRFRNVISWTSLIGGYAESGFGLKALQYFEQMKSDGVDVNAVTLGCILKVCGTIGALEKGQETHLDIVLNGYDCDISLKNTLIGMYAKCGFLMEAQDIFDELPFHDVVSWSALIAGYAEHGPAQVAVKFFERMQLNDDIFPNRVTFAAALKACGNLGALDKGHQIHLEVTKKGLEEDPHTTNTLISMYARCCRLAEAQNVFDTFPVLDVGKWSSMIKGYGLNHAGEMAVQCFRDMKECGVEPNSITFTCLLTACSHANLVADGLNYFKSMREDHGIAPLPEHYACIISLLARSGHLFEAEEFLESSCALSKETWAALLTACKTHGEVELGQRCFQELIKLDQHEGAAWYVLMADIYANAGRWEDVYKIEQLRIKAGAYKKPAVAVIEINRKLHEFVVGHNQNTEISSMLRSWKESLKEEGHVPPVNQVLRPIPDKVKESSLCDHAEKLAIAFGILNTASGQSLRVSKNLRMCNDCHMTSKMLSRKERREIILQDSSCIHHFKNGECSCGDLF